MSFELSYELQVPTHPAMAWEAYSALVEAQWQALRATSAPEAFYQEFLERHPCMLPWVYGEFGVGHHGAFPGAVVSQPILPGLRTTYPDFLWLCADSEACYAVLIEIETPDKPWATASGQQHHKFTQALNQLDDWKAWFEDPANVAVFKRDYRFAEWPAGTRPFRQRYILIYGQRDDVSLTEAVIAKRGGRRRVDEVHMTFDRLRPQYDLQYYMSVRLSTNGYRALVVPPSVRLGPTEAEYWSLVTGKEEAVLSSPDLAEARKQFLIARWPYWDAWARMPKKGLQRVSDWE